MPGSITEFQQLKIIKITDVLEGMGMFGVMRQAAKIGTFELIKTIQAGR